MKIKGLETTIKQTIYDFKERKNYLENALETSNNEIISLNKDIEKKDRQIKTYNEVIDSKNNRLLQLEKLFQGTAKIFTRQHNYVDHLKEQLEKEKEEKGISQEQVNHLQTDMERLDKEKQELAERIKEL